jgi:hypothetical protein
MTSLSTTGSAMCDKYAVDIMAAGFGTCTCGKPKSDHSQSSLHTATPPKKVDSRTLSPGLKMTSLPTTDTYSARQSWTFKHSSSGSEFNGEYSGSMKNGEPHGQGTIFFADGDSYNGEWKEGHRHGYGTHIWKSLGLQVLYLCLLFLTFFKR